MNATTLYQQNAIITQNQAHLVVMLYDGAIRFMKRAHQAIGEGNCSEKTILLLKAQDIIFELNASLDMEVGEEVARNLRPLYTYLWSQINKVNIHNDIALLAKLTTILETLSMAWKKIST